MHILVHDVIQECYQVIFFIAFLSSLCHVSIFLEVFAIQFFHTSCKVLSKLPSTGCIKKVDNLGEYKGIRGVTRVSRLGGV